MTSTSDPWICPRGIADLVSIVVPTFNRSDLLSETLTSLVGQDYRPIEIVVVDDGSDDTAVSEAVSQTRQRAPDGVQVRFFRQDPAGGPAARNRGAQESTGEYIVFMDDDDVATANFLSARVGSLRAEGANLAYGSWQQFVYSNGFYHLSPTKGRMPAACGSAWEAFLGRWELLLQGCVLRRSLVSKAGPWRTDLHKSQDLEYKARLLSLESRPVFSPDGLVFYRLHDRSVSGNLTSVKFDSYVQAIEIVESMAVARDDYPTTKQILAEYLWHHAFWLYAKGEFARGYRELRRAKKHSPEIWRTKGVLRSTLDVLGLDVGIGPAYYLLAKCKAAAGMSKYRFVDVCRRLPNTVLDSPLSSQVSSSAAD